MRTLLSTCTLHRMPNLTLTRTPDEILARMEEVKSSDMFGAQTSDLIEWLPWDRAKHLYKDEYVATVDAGDEPEPTPDTPDVVTAARNYLGFAIGKATDHRGLSASRSLDHYRAWLWLMGDETYNAVDWDDYAQYGAPVLRQIATLIEAPWPADNEALNRMADGNPCTDDCQEGCGS